MLTKANDFVTEKKNKDVTGRNIIIKELRRKVNKIDDQLSRLQTSIAQCELDIHADKQELLNVEMRQGAIDEFLSVAIGRLEKRVERPLEEQAKDPAHYALE